MQHDNLSNIIPSVGYFNNRSNASTWEIEESKIDFIDLTYVLSGEATYTINHKTIQVKAGDLLCIPSGSTRYAISNRPKDLECFATNFLLHDTATGKEVQLPLPLVSPLGVHGDIVSHYLRLKQAWEEQPPGYILCVRAHFLLILQRILAVLVFNAGTQGIDIRVRKAMKMVRENFNQDVDTHILGEAVGLNPVYFGTLFKKETGVSVREYLNQVRLNQAEEMLREGRYSVTEIAVLCGFGDLFYFSRLYKIRKGVPPSAVHSKGIID